MLIVTIVMMGGRSGWDVFASLVCQSQEGVKGLFPFLDFPFLGRGQRRDGRPFSTYYNLIAKERQLNQFLKTFCRLFYLRNHFHTCLTRSVR